MRLLPELMFGILEGDVPLDELTNLLGSMNTVGRLITRVDSLASIRGLNSSEIVEYGLDVLYEFLDYFREQQQKIITLFENESSMKWLFKEKWNYVWNGNKWVEAEESDDFEPDIEILGDERNRAHWTNLGYTWDEDNEEWVEQDDDEREYSEEEREYDQGYEDSDDEGWEANQYEVGDDRNQEFWTERGRAWDDEYNEWVEPDEGFEPDINSLGDERNQEFWADEGCIWDEENKKWVEPDRFSNSRLSQQWFPRFGDEWSEGLRQWVKRGDFKPLYLTEPRHMIGAKDVVYDTVFDIERTIASVEFDRVLCEDGTANLANLKFVRIDVQYQGLNKDIEPFDMVLCNNKESFVKEIERTGTGPTDVKVNVKVPQEREDACKLHELTYLKNGENCLWRSLPQNGQMKLETEDRSKIIHFAKDEHGTVVARKGNFDGRDITNIEIFDKDNKPVGYDHRRND